jgi:hypothetical protein
LLVGRVEQTSIVLSGDGGEDRELKNHAKKETPPGDALGGIGVGESLIGGEAKGAISFAAFEGLNRCPKLFSDDLVAVVVDRVVEIPAGDVAALAQESVPIWPGRIRTPDFTTWLSRQC